MFATSFYIFNDVLFAILFKSFFSRDDFLKKIEYSKHSQDDDPKIKSIFEKRAISHPFSVYPQKALQLKVKNFAKMRKIETNFYGENFFLLLMLMETTKLLEKC